MNQVQTHDLQLLARYTFSNQGKKNNQLLGLKWVKGRNGWTQQLIEVNRQDVTCWTLFLSLFNWGKLAHISVSLDKICHYLAQYQWKSMQMNAAQNHQTLKIKAFETVCHLANRQLSHRKVQLFKQVSDFVPSSFNHYWNPAMNGRFLCDLHRYQLPAARGVQLRFKNSKIVPLPHQKFNAKDLQDIEVGYEYETASCGDDHYYRYPHPPYFQTNLTSNQRPRRREI